MRGVKTNEGKGKNIGVKNEDTIIPILEGWGLCILLDGHLSGCAIGVFHYVDTFL